MGGIGILQARASSQRAERAFEVARTLSTTIDAQHTASVVLADAAILAQPLSATDRVEVVEQMTEHAGELREQLETLNAAEVGDEFRVLRAEFEPTIEALLADSDRLARSSAVLALTDLNSVREHWGAFDEQSDAVKTLLSEVSVREVTAANAGAESTTVILIIVTVISATLVGGVVWLIARLIARPIRLTKALLERVAAGDFTGRIDVRVADDLGLMGRALNTTVESVGAAIGRITTEAAALSGAAGRLTAVSQQVAAGADQVSADSAAASASATRVSEDVQAIATGADQMQSSIAEIARNAESATGIVNTAVAAAGRATDTVTRLASSSDQIGAVAKVIAGIAEQTNLLALNATIEAARAGELGKGFAVVAGEVKDLARETATATEDIARQIAALQTDSTDAAAAITGISTNIDQVADIQQIIAAAVGTQSTATREIGERVAQTAHMASDIAQRVAAVSGTSREATESASDTRRAAEEVSATVGNLEDVVNQFQVTSSG
ncbi:methyl-accepting chemotaxis protein [Pilimelia terevasa]|uniref:Methyl-accepting chemotaxis protein n=1 Tax=Pilimelia terevasa TaxID=53372 RepID=A0A8J3BNV9_9ACTN|nr:methyl-accepting chemotaxis protein [Pilimelia terevasa]